MKERPILFSAPMVRALLSGTKTQTRRVVKPQPYADEQGNACWNGSNFGQDGRGPLFRSLASPVPSSRTKRVHCPYGAPGDRLWVRETWCSLTTGFAYAADPIWSRAPGERWRPSIHMPRAASRITLEITGVRVERLQDISEPDAQAEGCALECMTPTGDDSGSAIHGPGGYRALWESINGPGSWEANPWVWVVEFAAASLGERGKG
jgi:hypothetical protein